MVVGACAWKACHVGAKPTSRREPPYTSIATRVVMYSSSSKQSLLVVCMYVCTSHRFVLLCVGAAGLDFLWLQDKSEEDGRGSLRKPVRQGCWFFFWFKNRPRANSQILSPGPQTTQKHFRTRRRTQVEVFLCACSWRRSATCPFIFVYTMYVF